MDVGLISIPPIETKKKIDRIFPFCSSLNYGLLSLASHLAHHGFTAKVFDPKEWQDGAAVEKILSWLKENQPKCVALSCISGFSYPTFKIIVKKIRLEFPDLPIIAGGKDHLALIAEEAMKECPEVDLIIEGEGELPLIEIMRKGMSRLDIESLEEIPNVFLRGPGSKLGKEEKTGCLFEIEKLIPFDFQLYENFKDHPPCIEVGRGCPYDCSFCPNKRKRIIKKDPKTIIDEIKKIYNLYNSEKLYLYFQAPMLLMSDNELIALANFRKSMGISFEWRAQTRVDYLQPGRLNVLGEAGARVIDLGLESGSLEMLAAMQKTENPEKYLSEASRIIHEAKKSKVKIKFNILFYAGERRESLLETFQFLNSHADFGWTISAYPLLIYPGTRLEENITPILERHGGSIDQSVEWRERHLAPVNPSHEFSYLRMQRIGILFGKAFQTAENYFNERRYGYYRPGVSYGDFIEYSNLIGFEDLPCSIDKKEMLQNRRVLQSFLEGEMCE